MLFLIVGRCDKHTVESECEPWHRLIGKHCQWKVHSAVSIQTQCCKNRANTSAIVSFLTHKLMSFQTATDEVSSFHYYAARTANRMFCLLLSSRLCTYCQPTLLYVASDACGERCGSVDIATRCKRFPEHKSEHWIKTTFKVYFSFLFDLLESGQGFFLLRDFCRALFYQSMNQKIQTTAKIHSCSPCFRNVMLCDW